MSEIKMQRVPPAPLRQGPRHLRAGFSLVEIAITLALLAFALVGLLGLIPVGLKTFGNAIDNTVQTQISQAIATRARETKFSELGGLNIANDPTPSKLAPDYYFDDQGQELVTTKGVPADYIYAAAVVVCNDPKIPYTNYPELASGGAQQFAANTQVATLKIVVTKRTAPEQSRVSFLHIANNGL